MKLVIQMSSSDSQYKEIIRDRINTINEKIASLQNKKHALFYKIDEEIKALEFERAALLEKLKAQERDKILSDFYESAVQSRDLMYDVNLEKQKNLEEEKKRLNEIKKNLSFRREKAKINRQIDRIDKKIKKLKDKNIHLGKTQRVVMKPKYRRELIKEGLLKRQEGRIEYNKKVSEDNRVLAQNTDTSKLFGEISKIFAERRSMKYRLRAERAAALLEEMKSHNTTIGIRGSRLIYIPKRLFYGMSFESEGNSHTM